MRIYQPVSLSQATSIDLDEEGQHHLRVLRAKVGDEVTLFNGLGGEYRARITAITKKSIEVLLLDFSAREAESPLSLCLAQGIARGEKMDFIVQKAVELGVSKIIPLATERSNVRLSQERADKRCKHWQSVVIGACEQSGRNQLPEVEAIQAFTDWLPFAQADEKFVLSPHGDFPLMPIKKVSGKSILLLIGPEGGLSADELRLAKAKGFKALTLGPRVLRAETAPIAALAIFQAYYGDLSQKD